MRKRLGQQKQSQVDWVHLTWGGCETSHRRYGKSVLVLKFKVIFIRTIYNYNLNLIIGIVFVTLQGCLVRLY